MVGDAVVCNVPGSWCHGMLGIITMQHATASDGISGCMVQIPGHGVTVVPLDDLIIVKNWDEALCLTGRS